MSDDIVESQSDNCEDVLKEEYLRHGMERVADILGISNPRYNVSLGSKFGDNYIGIIYRVILEGDKNDAPSKVHTIVKVAPKDAFIREMVNAPYFFPREHLFYTKIVPIFEDFLKSKNKNLEYIAKCYFSSDVEREEMLCLEDLKPKGFVMRDRVKQMDFAHTSLAFRALGRFHAISFALRDQRPEIFENNIVTLKETLFRPEVCASQGFVDRCEKIGNVVKTALADEDPKYTEIFSEFSKNVLSHLERSCRGHIAEPYAVLCHGDYWMNNMLFKYDEDSTEPKEIYFLDFQLARYASPVLDISYTIFCNCSQDLRSEYYEELIKIYHESLSVYLLELGSDPKKLFPFEALQKQLNDFSIYVAGMAMMVIPLFVSQGEDVKNIEQDESNVNNLSERIKRDTLLKVTLRDTYKDLIDRNYIK